MKIINNLINKINFGNISPAKTKQEKSTSTNTNYNSTSLPSTYTTGLSQVNSNLPVAYKKIGEVSVPGLKEKATIFKLANGQKVIIQPKDGPTFIKTTYNVGSLN